MDNVNFDAKTDWKLNDAVMPQDANRWEKVLTTRQNWLII